MNSNSEKVEFPTNARALGYINVWPEEGNKHAFSRRQRQGIEKKTGKYIPAALWFIDGVPPCHEHGERHRPIALFEHPAPGADAALVAEYAALESMDKVVCTVCGCVGVRSAEVRWLSDEEGGPILTRARDWAARLGF
jgi:hypothetical protein